MWHPSMAPADCIIPHLDLNPSMTTASCPSCGKYMYWFNSLDTVAAQVSCTITQTVHLATNYLLYTSCFLKPVICKICNCSISLCESSN